MQAEPSGARPLKVREKIELLSYAVSICLDNKKDYHDVELEEIQNTYVSLVNIVYEPVVVKDLGGL